MNVQTVLANMVVYVYLKDTESNVTAQPDFQDDDVKLTLMNVQVNLATMVVLALICRKDTAALVLQDTEELTVKKKDLNVETILALKGLCAKMNQVMTTTPACVDLDIQVSIVM